MATSTSIREGEMRLQPTDDRPLPSEDYVPRFMPQVLGTFDMTAAFIMAVFWVSNVTTIVTGGPAGLTYFVLCCVAFLYPVPLSLPNSVLTILAVLFIGAAALAWLLKGKPSATNFADPTGWGISVAPQTNNLYLLGTVTLALLGANMPLNMAGELRNHKTILRHLLWGSLIVMSGYLIITFSILAVEGQNAAFTAPNSVALLLDAVDKGLGKFIGGITAVCMMTFFIVVGVFENATSARLLMVAALDERLPFGVARLNKQRIPANAIIFQTICACGFTAVIFFGTPLITFLGNTAALTTEAYTVTAAGLLLVWAFSFLFPFIDLTVLYVRHRSIFAPHRIFPMPVLIISCIVGPLVCLATIVDTLVYSWIPTLIGNNTWWYLVGGLTAVCLTLSAVGSILASGEASWQQANV